MAQLSQIVYKTHPSTEEIEVLYEGLAHYAHQQKNQAPIESFGFFIYDEDQKIVAGTNGTIYYGCLYIDSLWVKEELRSQKLGTQLINAAEELGQQKSCLFASVNTMDWEALDFYQKRGYTVEFKREGYLHNSILYFLKKPLL